MPLIDEREYRNIFVPHEGIDPDQHFVVHYKVIPRDGITIREVAARIAMLTSLGTTKALPYEDHHNRVLMSAKVLAAKEEGDVSIAYPLVLCSKNEGLTQLLTIVFYAASYNYTKELWVDDIEFPKSFIAYFKGPRFGIKGIRDKFEVWSRPLLGVILKPRLGVSLDVIADKCLQCLVGGADFIVDDELFLDRDGEFAFETRIPALMGVVNKAVKATGIYKGYVVNVGASPLKALAYSRIAKSESVSGLLVNAFTMGFSAVQEIINELNGSLPVTIHNMGVGILTRPLVSKDLRRPTGVSDTLIVKLSRLIGGDAVHAGISKSDWYHEDAWGPHIVALRHKLHNILPAFPVAAGGLTIANLWENISSLGPDVIFESGTGILGYPYGPEKGAKDFRKLIDNLNSNMSDEEAHKTIEELGLKDKQLGQALVLYGYKDKATMGGEK